MNGIEFHPDYYRQLVQLEIDSGFAFRQGLWLGDLRPELLTEEQRNRLQRLQATGHIPQQTKPRVPISSQLRFEAFFE